MLGDEPLPTIEHMLEAVSCVSMGIPRGSTGAFEGLYRVSMEVSKGNMGKYGKTFSGVCKCFLL